MYGFVLFRRTCPTGTVGHVCRAALVAHVSPYSLILLGKVRILALIR